MPAGQIRHRVQRQPEGTAKPTLELPWQLRGAEPVFRIMIDIAAEARDVQLDVRDVIEQLLEAMKEQTELLKVIATSLEESHSAGPDSIGVGKPEPGVVGDLPARVTDTDAGKSAEKPDD